jgi:DNA-binding transcriptional LysR family regulator
MTTERLYEFLVLAQTLNYGKAARKLYITQSVLSRHIGDLEAEVGNTLLERDSHKVSLTQAGRLLARRAAELTRQYDEAVSTLRLSDVKASGIVRISCTSTVVCGHLSGYLRSFAQRYPDIRLELDVTDECSPFDPESCDVRFTPFEASAEGWQCKTAYSDPALLVLRPEHRLIQNHQVELRELIGETVFVPYPNDLFSSYTYNRQLIDRATANRAGITKVASAEHALLEVSLNRGVALLPRHLVRQGYGELMLVSIATPGVRFNTLAYLRSEAPNPAAKLFYDELNPAPEDQ